MVASSRFLLVAGEAVGRMQRGARGDRNTIGSWRPPVTGAVSRLKSPPAKSGGGQPLWKGCASPSFPPSCPHPRHPTPESSAFRQWRWLWASWRPARCVASPRASRGDRYFEGGKSEGLQSRTPLSALSSGTERRASGVAGVLDPGRAIANNWCTRTERQRGNVLRRRRRRRRLQRIRRRLDRNQRQTKTKQKNRSTPLPSTTRPPPPPSAAAPPPPP